LADLLGPEVRLVWLAEPTRHQPRDDRPDADARLDAGDRVSFADGYPLLLANSASLAQLNDWLAESGSTEGPLPMTRFRPNVVVDDAPPWAEDDWTGRRLRIGSAVFQVADGCDRCVVTTTDQETGVRGKQPLRILAERRKFGRDLLFGQNLVPVGSVRAVGSGADGVPVDIDDFGTIGVGDPVELLP
ncbi:MOSC domain-containing protein, partial [Micromonospora zhanjiangensis]